MARIQLQADLQQLIATIATRNTYYGNKVSPAIISMLEIEIREDGGGILAPFWLSVLERGRGPRKNNRSSDLVSRMYAWMEARGMFRSTSAEGKLAEAKSLTWYINKYGTKHWRSKTFVDIYTSAREATALRVQQKYLLAAEQITKQIL